MTEHQKKLLESGRATVAMLNALGFRVVATAVAGENSGSVWIYKDGTRAEMKVVNMNQPDFYHANGAAYSAAEQIAKVVEGFNLIQR